MNEKRGRPLAFGAASRLIALGALALLPAGCGPSVATGSADVAVQRVSASPARSGAPAGSSSARLAGSVATYRGDAARTGSMPGPAPAGTPGVAWTFEAGAPIGSSPVVVDGRVYVLGTNGVVHGLDLATGEQRWDATLGADASASPLVTDELLIVGDAMGTVHALAITDGSARWTVDTDGAITGAAAADGGVAVVATMAGSAYAIDVPTGIVRWRTALRGPVSTSVAIADGTVFLGAGPDLTALALADGSVRWARAVSEDGRIGTPTAAGGLVYAATGLDADNLSLHGVVALDAATGAQRWRFTSPTSAAVYTPAVVAGRAFIVGEDRQVTALDAQTGTVIWTTVTEQVNEAVAAVADGLVFVAGNGGAMNALDAGTGAIRWTVSYRGVPYGPVVVGGYVLVGTNLGALVAIGELAK